MKYEQDYRRDHPQSEGETDKDFDRLNYIEWLDRKYEALIKLMSLSRIISESDKSTLNPAVPARRTAPPPPPDPPKRKRTAVCHNCGSTWVIKTYDGHWCKWCKTEL